jgi:hypothetical protein
MYGNLPEQKKGLIVMMPKAAQKAAIYGSRMPRVALSAMEARNIGKDLFSSVLHTF